MYKEFKLLYFLIKKIFPQIIAKILHNKQENFISPIAEVAYILWVDVWIFVLINKLVY